MAAEGTQRLTLKGWGRASAHDVARVLDQTGNVVAVVAEPSNIANIEALRDAIVEAVLETDFGDTILAGVVFAPSLGGDAIGFT